MKRSNFAASKSQVPSVEMRVRLPPRATSIESQVTKQLNKYIDETPLIPFLNFPVSECT